MRESDLSALFNLAKFSGTTDDVNQLLNSLKTLPSHHLFEIEIGTIKKTCLPNTTIASLLSRVALNKAL